MTILTHDPLNKYHVPDAGSLEMVASNCQEYVSKVYNTRMKRVSSCLLLLITLFILTPVESFCQEKTRIAVLPITGADLRQADLEAINLLFEQNLLQS